MVKMEGSKLLYDIPQLMKGRQVNNAWDALRLLPGVDAKENKLMLGASTVNVIIDGKVSTMSEEQLATLLKTMPASRLERAEVMTRLLLRCRSGVLPSMWCFVITMLTVRQ